MTKGVCGKKKILIIVNPIAGKGLSIPYLRKITEKLGTLGFEFHVVVTKKSGGEESLIPSNLAFHYLLILGGDGTLNEVLNELGKKEIPILTPLIIFPVGLENLFARELGIKPIVEDIFQIIKNGKERIFDIGKIDGKLFLSVADCGFAAQVVKEFSSFREGPITLASYIPSIIKVFKSYDFPSISVEVDGQSISKQAMGVIIGNIKHYGGKMKVNPLASPQDGLLDVCVFQNRSRLYLLKYYFGVLARRHTNFPEVQYLKGRVIKLTSNENVAVQADGDYVGSLPKEMRIIPMAVPVLVK